MLISHFVVISNNLKGDQLFSHIWAGICVRLCGWQDGASGCNGILQPQTDGWVAVYSVSRLTFRWLQRWLNAHLTHSRPLWCNPVEVISFTGLSTPANIRGERGGGWVSKSVFNQPATKHSPKQNQSWCPDWKIKIKNTQQKIDMNKNFGNVLSFRDNCGRKGLHIDNANCDDCCLCK